MSEDQIVVVCYPVDPDLPLPPNASVGECSVCGRSVIVGKDSMPLLAQGGKVLCYEDGLAVMESDADVEINEVPGQVETVTRELGPKAGAAVRKKIHHLKTTVAIGGTPCPGCGKPWPCPDHYCMSGREADMGGRWLEPCPKFARNLLGAGDEYRSIVIQLRFCDDHMQELIDAGLITEPFLDPAEYDRRLR